MGLGICLLTGIAVYARKSTELSALFRQRISRDQEAEHALNRLTFGPRPGDVQRVSALGLKKWIDLQLHPGRIPENPELETKLRPLDTLGMSTVRMLESYPPPALVKAMVAGKLPFPEDPDKRMMVDRLAARMQGKTDQAGSVCRRPAWPRSSQPEQLRVLRGGTAQQKLDLFNSFSQDRQDTILESMGQGMRMQLYAAAPPALRRRIQSANGPQAMVAQDLMAAKLFRAVYGERQLEEVLADFWYNHFNVFIEKGADRYLVTAYERDAIRPHVLGKFEDLLRATAQSPAMLFYLDNWESVGPQSPAGMRRKRGLNENYGRELLELHTLGVDGGYTQKDVTEVARCFTGWTIGSRSARPSLSSIRGMHDEGEKIVLGVRIPAGGGSRMASGCCTCWRIIRPPRALSRANWPCVSWPTIRPETLVDRMAAHVSEERRRPSRRAENHVRFARILVARRLPYEDQIAARNGGQFLARAQRRSGFHARSRPPVERTRRAALP